MKKHFSEDVLLSFIIPVYNVEKYLSECVDSILHNLTDECEIILVNDGSDDASGDICTKYAANDHRIHVIHKENGGPSSARNAGLSLAKGRYVTFVDSDDKIYSESITGILNWILNEDSDICFMLSEKVYPDNIKEDMREGIIRTEIYQRNREDAIKHLTSRPKYSGSAWAKLYKRDFLTVNDLHFPYDQRYSEDLCFVRDCILNAQSFDILNIPYYMYRQNRQGSITNSIKVKNFGDLLTFISESADKLTVNKKVLNATDKCFMGVVAYEYSVLLYIYDALSVNERKTVLNDLKKFKWVLKYASNKKIKGVAFVTNIFGLSVASRILNILKK